MSPRGKQSQSEEEKQEETQAPEAETQETETPAEEEKQEETQAAAEEKAEPVATKNSEKKGYRLTKVACNAESAPMVDITTGKRYTNSPTPAEVWDGSWIDCQIKAGLMAEVKE